MTKKSITLMTAISITSVNFRNTPEFFSFRLEEDFLRLPKVLLIQTRG